MSGLNITPNFSLKSFNSFGIDVSAPMFCRISSTDDVREAITQGLFNEEFLILGGGTNILFTKDPAGIVFHDEITGIQIADETADDVFVTAAGGEIWHNLVMFAVDKNLGGIENLSLIPGTVGAAPIQNIGAYGVELLSVFQSLAAIDIRSGEEKIFNKDDCNFGYRNSVFKQEFKGKYFITSVTLKLQKKPVLNLSYGAINKVLRDRGIANPTVKDISDAVIFIRNSKLPDPKILGNAGSFFKNPEIPSDVFDKLKNKFHDMPGYQMPDNQVKVPAGWLIEQCGWKGKRIGNTGAHKDQALVLVNYGDAAGDEIKSLAMEIKNSVAEKFGIEINPEVNII